MQGVSAKDIGRRGEEIAAGYLKKQGFRVLERNFKCKAGEIDLIARKRGGGLYFFEVKARGAHALAAAIEAVGDVQVKRIRRAAEWYLMRHEREWGATPPPCSFGVIAIEYTNDEATNIECLLDVF